MFFIDINKRDQCKTNKSQVLDIIEGSCRCSRVGNSFPSEGYLDICNIVGGPYKIRNLLIRLLCPDYNRRNKRYFLAYQNVPYYSNNIVWFNFNSTR